MKNLGTIIASNITYLRRKNNLTQQELASKVSYSDNAVSRWERGEVTPSVETLDIIATFFGVSVSDLIDEHFAVKDEPKDRISRIQQMLVILFSVSVVWTLALIGFIYTNTFNESFGKLSGHGWLLFIISVPISLLVLYYFNRIWGNKIFHLIIFSLFWWSLLATFYLFLLVLSKVNLWLIFLLGIPIQLAQLLWYTVRR